MEKRLSALMDFQKFEGNADMQRVIDSVHSRYAVQELSLDEMEWVAAAGRPEGNPGKNDRRNPKNADRRS